MNAIQPSDILCTSPYDMSHVGNRNFAAILSRLQMFPQDVEDQAVRFSLSQRISREFARRRGRFLGRTSATTWKELDERHSLGWIGHLLLSMIDLQTEIVEVNDVANQDEVDMSRLLPEFIDTRSARVIVGGDNDAVTFQDIMFDEEIMALVD